MASGAETENGRAWLHKELRIVLLGRSWLETSSAGNIILGDGRFDTTRDIEMCVRREGIDAGGSRLVVVCTPKRWIQYSVQDALLVEQRVIASASQCSPGPHAFLIVIPLDSLKGREWTVEGPLELLSHAIWRHTIVVFTRWEKLGPTSIEKLIARHQFLQEIVEKCGNRYHLLNTRTRPQGVGSQVTELLGKIGEMVSGNDGESDIGAYFPINEKILTKAGEKIRAVDERANLRRMKVQRQRETLRSLIIDKANNPSELRVVIVGERLVGKSTTGNLILGREEFKAGNPTRHCEEKECEVAGRKVAVIDTPGWHSRYCLEETPDAVRQEIAHSAYQWALEPHTFLVVIRSDEMFTETDRRRTEEHLRLLGRTAWENSIVLFTVGDNLGDTTVEQHMERWAALLWLVEKCGNRYHVLDYTKQAAGHSQVTELLEKIEELTVGNDCQHLLRLYLRVEEDKRKQRKSSEAIQKKMEALEGEYEQLKQLSNRRQQRVQALDQHCEEKEGKMKQLQQQLETRERKAEEMKRKCEGQIEDMRQKCAEKDRMLEQMEYKRGLPVFSYMEMDSVVTEKEVAQPEEVKDSGLQAGKRTPRTEHEPGKTALKFEAVALGAVIGAIAGSMRGCLGVAAGTAIGASLGALVEAWRTEYGVGEKRVETCSSD